jgi:hypothetical protein
VAEVIPKMPGYYARHLAGSGIRHDADEGAKQSLELTPRHDLPTDNQQTVDNRRSRSGRRQVHTVSTRMLLTGPEPSFRPSRLTGKK